MRAGEKLHEEHNVSEVDNPRILRAQEDMLAWDELNNVIDSLGHEKLRKLLIQMVSDSKP